MSLFFVSGNLRSHYRINHNEENMTTCAHCEFRTSSRKAMKEHMKRHEVNASFFSVAIDCEFPIFNPPVRLAWFDLICSTLQ